MLFIGLGGAGSKLVSNFSKRSIAVNVSNKELEKVDVEKKILAFASSAKGQLGGSRKNPEIGKRAFDGIQEELLAVTSGNTIISSSGGGSGSGICSKLLDQIASKKSVAEEEKVSFIVILPSVREAQEYTENSIIFLKNHLFPALKSANTGNVFLLSNDWKFQQQISESQYNETIKESLNNFYAIVDKSDHLPTIEGHIDREDFFHFSRKSFYNHFTCFEIDIDKDFAKQLEGHYNPLMFIPSKKEDWMIEVLFLLELPEGVKESVHY